MPAARIIRLPTRPLTKSKRAPLTERKRPERTIIRPTAIGPQTSHERWIDRMEARLMGGRPIHKPLIPEDEMQTITLPRRQREGSITDDQVREAAEALADIDPEGRNAVVVCSGMDSENSARGKARALADRYAEMVKAQAISATVAQGENPNFPLLAAHAVPDPNAEGKWIGAVSPRPADWKPRAKSAPKAKPAAK